MSTRSHNEMTVEELAKLYSAEVVKLDASKQDVVATPLNKMKVDIIALPGQNPNFNKDFHCGNCQTKRFRKECCFKYEIYSAGETMEMHSYT